LADSWNQIRGFDFSQPLYPLGVGGPFSPLIGSGVGTSADPLGGPEFGALFRSQVGSGVGFGIVSHICFGAFSGLSS